MKRLVVCLLILSLTLLSCAGCQSRSRVMKQPDADPTQPTPQTAQTTQPTTQTTSATRNADTRTVLSPSADDVRILNTFLSNFSEAYIRDIQANDTLAVTAFAVAHCSINYPDQFRAADGVEAWNAKYSRYDVFNYGIPESVIREKTQRFFGTDPLTERGVHQSAAGDAFYYADGMYYIQYGNSEPHLYFTNIDDLTDNGDGTVTARYQVFFCTGDEYGPGVEHPPREVYRGFASEKLSFPQYSYAYSGQARLRRADIGKGYAPYRILELTAQ